MQRPASRDHGVHHPIVEMTSKDKGTAAAPLWPCTHPLVSFQACHKTPSSKTLPCLSLPSLVL